LQLLRKIPLGGILGEIWEILGYFGEFFGFWKFSKFDIFFQFKKIMFEKKSDEKLIRA
jgi:hypothetical protein